MEGSNVKQVHSRHGVDKETHIITGNKVPIESTPKRPRQSDSHVDVGSKRRTSSYRSSTESSQKRMKSEESTRIRVNSLRSAVTGLGSRDIICVDTKGGNKNSPTTPNTPTTGITTERKSSGSSGKSISTAKVVEAGNETTFKAPLKQNSVEKTRAATQPNPISITLTLTPPSSQGGNDISTKDLCTAKAFPRGLALYCASEVEELKKDLESEREKNRAFQREEDLKRKLQSENARLEEKLKQNEEQLKIARGRIATLESKTTCDKTQEQEIAKLKQELTKLESGKKQLKKEKETVLDDNIELTVLLKDAKQEITKLKAEITKLQAERETERKAQEAELLLLQSENKQLVDLKKKFMEFVVSMESCADVEYKNCNHQFHDDSHLKALRDQIQQSLEQWKTSKLEIIEKKKLVKQFRIEYFSIGKGAAAGTILSSTGATLDDVLLPAIAGDLPKNSPTPSQSQQQN